MVAPNIAEEPLAVETPPPLCAKYRGLRTNKARGTHRVIEARVDRKNRVTFEYTASVMGAGSGTPFASNRVHAKRSASQPAKCPLFDPVFPLVEHDRPDHGLTARRADRAVL